MRTQLSCVDGTVSTRALWTRERMREKENANANAKGERERGREMAEAVMWPSLGQRITVPDSKLCRAGAVPHSR